MLRLARTNGDHPDFHALVVKLDEELCERYPTEQGEYALHNKIESNRTVVLAYIDSTVVGCACLKPVDVFTVELKRMYVLPEHRGKGVAMAIMKELEEWAHELKYKKIILQTGDNQPEAVAVYKKAGFTIIECFGPYVGMESSICMAKFIP